METEAEIEKQSKVTSKQTKLNNSASFKRNKQKKKKQSEHSAKEHSVHKIVLTQCFNNITTQI